MQFQTGSFSRLTINMSSLSSSIVPKRWRIHLDCNCSALWWGTSSCMHWTRISTSASCGSYPIFGSTSTSGIPRSTDICKYGDNDNDNNNINVAALSCCSLHRVLGLPPLNNATPYNTRFTTCGVYLCPLGGIYGYFPPLRVLGLPPLSRSLELLGTTDSSSTRALWWTEGGMAWERCDDNFEMLK